MYSLRTGPLPNFGFPGSIGLPGVGGTGVVFDAGLGASGAGLGGFTIVPPPDPAPFGVRTGLPPGPVFRTNFCPGGFFDAGAPPPGGRGMYDVCSGESGGGTFIVGMSPLLGPVPGAGTSIVGISPLLGSLPGEGTSIVGMSPWGVPGGGTAMVGISPFPPPVGAVGADAGREGAAGREPGAGIFWMSVIL